MVTYFWQAVQTFISYCGNGILPILFIAADIYILFTEKNKWKKIALGIFPICMLIIYFFPVTKMLFEKLGIDSSTYYRFLWLIPMGVCVSYAACKLFENKKRPGLIISVAIVIICSSFSLVYRSEYITKAENRYHIPQAAIDICNIIAPTDDTRIRAAFPPELVYFIRQYNTDIMMPYGRDFVEAQWDYWNAVCEQMNVTADEGYDIEALLEATRESKCRYIILNLSIPTSIDPETELTLIANIDGYAIYEDLEVETD